MAFPGVFDRDTFHLEPAPVVFQYLKRMRQREREQAELHSLATSIQTAMFYNTHKAKNAPHADARDFNPFQRDAVLLHKSTAEEFFRLTNERKLPAWVIALAPVKDLRRVAGKAPPSKRLIRT